MTVARRILTADSFHPFIEKLAAYVNFADELGAHTIVFERARIVLRGRGIVTQHRSCHPLNLLSKGLTFECKILANCRRLILNPTVPGDLIWLSICVFESAIASVSKLTEVSVLPFEFDELGTRHHGQRSSPPPLINERHMATRNERGIKSPQGLLTTRAIRECNLAPVECPVGSVASSCVVLAMKAALS